jgi:hypothetical protein
MPTSEAQKQASRRWKQNNPDYKEIQNALTRRWQLENDERLKEYQREYSRRYYLKKKAEKMKLQNEPQPELGISGPTGI